MSIKLPIASTTKDGIIENASQTLGGFKTLISSATPIQLKIATNATDATNKEGSIGVGHYTNSEEPVPAFYISVTSTLNSLRIGGGDVSGNAATSIDFYTAANNTTVTGTSHGSVSSAGIWRLGPSGGSSGTHTMFGNFTMSGSGTTRFRVNSGGVSNQAIIEINAVDTGDSPSLQFMQAGTMQSIIRGNNTTPFQVLNSGSNVMGSVDTEGAWTLGSASLTTGSHLIQADGDGDNIVMRISRPSSTTGKIILATNGADRSQIQWSTADIFRINSSAGTEIYNFGLTRFVASPGTYDTAKTFAVNAASTANLAAAGGLTGFLFINFGSDNNAMFALRNTTSNLIFNPGGWGTSVGASTHNVYHNGTQWVIQNTTGGSVTYSVFFIRLNTGNTLA